ncbi:MAG: hypothetical protein IT355_04590 [Gemmatimonadaceae bacterium]|nr:hypothetical protein [Gemmatimonadaceae bacterium]
MAALVTQIPRWLVLAGRRCCAFLACLVCVQVVSVEDAEAQGARYRVVSTAVIALERAGQPPLVDTLTTASLVTIALSAVADTVATMSLDSLQVTSTGMVKRPPDAFTRGVSVLAVLTGGRPRVTGDSATACASERPLAGLLPELLPLLPVPLVADASWSDTLTVTTCRAGLPVTAVTVVTNRLLTGMDSTSLLLERRAVIRVSGGATLRAQQVTLNGSGTSESLGVVLVGTRQLQSWRGTQSLELELTNGQQTRRIVQQITDSATLLP